MDATERQKPQRGSPFAEDDDVFCDVFMRSPSSDGISTSMKGLCRFTVEEYSTVAPMPVLQNALNLEQLKRASKALSEMLHDVQPTLCERSVREAPTSNTVSQSCSSSSSSSGPTSPNSAETCKPSTSFKLSRTCCQAATQDCQTSKAGAVLALTRKGACAPKHIHAPVQALRDIATKHLAPVCAVTTIKQYLSDALLDPNEAAMAARQGQTGYCALDIDSGMEVLISAVDKDLASSMKYIRRQLSADSSLAAESYCALIRSTIETALTDLLQEQSVIADSTRVFYAAAQVGRSAMALITAAYSTPQNESAACCTARANLTLWLAGVDRSDININKIISNMPRDAASSPQIAALLKAAQAKNRATDAAAVDRKLTMSASARGESAVAGNAKGWGLSEVLSGFKGMFKRSNLNFQHESGNEPPEAGKTAAMDAVPPMTATDSAPDAAQPTACSHDSSSSSNSSSDRVDFNSTSKAFGASFMHFNWNFSTRPASTATTACCALVASAVGGSVSAVTVHKVKDYLSDTQQDPAPLAKAFAQAHLPDFAPVPSSSICHQQYVDAVDGDLVRRFGHIRSCLPANLCLECESGTLIIRSALAKALADALQEQALAMANPTIVCQAACYVGRYAVASLICRPAGADEPKYCSLIQNYFVLCLMRLARPASYIDVALPNVPRELLDSPHVAGLYTLYQSDRANMDSAKADKPADIQGTAAFASPATAGHPSSSDTVALTKELPGLKEFLQDTNSSSSSNIDNSSKVSRGSRAKRCSSSKAKKASKEELSAARHYHLHMPDAGIPSWLRHFGWSALHYAVASHKVQWVQQLLDAGADLEAPEPLLQLTPLHLACMGKIKDPQQLEEMKQAAESSLYRFQAYCKNHGPANAAIVRMLLDKMANPSIQVASGPLAFVTPLHILSCWSAGNMPAVDQHDTRGSAATCNNSTQAVSELNQQCSCVNGVLLAGADLAPAQLPKGETFVTLAAVSGASDVISCLRELGDTNVVKMLVNKPRLIDGARPLELAMSIGHTSTALSLLKAGAKVVPASSASPAYTAASTPEQPMSKMKDSLRPEMLLMTAVNHLDYHGRVALLQQLLGQGGDIWLEEQWPATGQTALNMAVGLGLVECVALLVAAGADVDAAAQVEPLPPLAAAVITGRAEIAQMLLDAGADHSRWSNPKTGYDLVQTAANQKHLDIVVMLVEAGASWAHPKSRIKGVPLYVPDILKARMSTTKVNVVERKLRLAEKAHKQRRAAAAAALAGHLTGVTDECKTATLAVAERIGLGGATGSIVAEVSAAASDIVPALAAAADQTAAADLSACDIDALVAVIDSVGSRAAADTNSTKNSNKKKKQQKHKSKGKQCKQAADISPATAGDAQGGTCSNDHCAGGVVEQTQLIVAEPQHQAASTQRSRQQQQLATEQPSVETIPAQAVMHETAIPQHDSLSEHAAGTVIASIDEDDDAVQAGSSVSQPLLASEAAAPQAVPAPTVAPPCASLAIPLPAAAPHLPLPPAAAAAPTLVPVGLQHWRGSLNPIFMYSRSGATSHRGISSVANGTAMVQPAAATTTAPAPPALSVLAETWQQQQRQGVPPGPCSTVLQNVLPLTTVPLTKAAAGEDRCTNVAAFPGFTERECIACLERPSNVLLLPCKHIVLCAVCADQLHARAALRNVHGAGMCVTDTWECLFDLYERTKLCFSQHALPLFTHS